jgi:Domain of unknown function (DUF4124)
VSQRIVGMATILPVLALCSLQVMADAKLYRWKDSEGNTVMSDRPPPTGVDFEAIATDSSVVRRVDGEPPPKKITSTSPPKKKATQSPQPTVKTVYKKNPEYCESARRNLTVIDQSARVRMKDENGEYYYISDEQRHSEREKNLEAIKMHCD